MGWAQVKGRTSGRKAPPGMMIPAPYGCALRRRKAQTHCLISSVVRASACRAECHRFNSGMGRWADNRAVTGPTICPWVKPALTLPASHRGSGRRVALNGASKRGARDGLAEPLRMGSSPMASARHRGRPVGSGAHIERGWCPGVRFPALVLHQMPAFQVGQAHLAQR